jgi:hypothetical protein
MQYFAAYVQNFSVIIYLRHREKEEKLLHNV